MPQAFYFHLEGLTLVQDKHGQKLPQRSQRCDRIQNTDGVRDPGVVVVVVDERDAEIHREPVFPKGHSVIVIEEHNAKLWTRTVRR